MDLRGHTPARPTDCINRRLELTILVIRHIPLCGEADSWRAGEPGLPSSEPSSSSTPPIRPGPPAPSRPAILRGSRPRSSRHRTAGHVSRPSATDRDSSTNPTRGSRPIPVDDAPRHSPMVPGLPASSTSLKGNNDSIRAPWSSDNTTSRVTCHVSRVTQKIMPSEQIND